MAKIYEQRIKPIVDDFRAYATVTAVVAPAPGVPSTTTIFSEKLKTGVRPKLVKFGNAVGPGGEPYVSFTLQVNGVPFYRFQNVTNMITDPANPESQLSFEEELQQGAVISVIALNTDTANAYPVTASVIVYYEDI